MTHKTRPAPPLRLRGGPAALAAITLLAAPLVAPRPAAAQLETVGRVLPLRFKIGALLPSDSDTKSATDDVHLSGEIDLILPSTGLGGSRTYITSGYSQNTSSGRKMSTIPLTIAQVRSPFNPVSGATGNLYYGAGTGVYIVRASGGGLESKTKTLFGGFLVAGYQSPSKFFLEAKYHLVSGDVEGLKPNGFALYLGTRL